MNQQHSLTFLTSSAILLLTCTAAMQAQEPAAGTKPTTSAEKLEHYERDGVDRTYALHNAPNQYMQNEIVTALRNMLDPQTKIFLVPSSGVIVVHAPAEAQERASKLLAALDRPHSRFRLTYTMTELDGTKKIGVQYFSMIVVSGQRAQMKQGSRIPLLTTGVSVTKPGDPIPAYTYIDIGMNFDATLDEIQGGAFLKEKVEQSSIAPGATMGGEPIIRQTAIEGTVTLVTGKPLAIGSLDVPGSTRHFDVEVVMEPVS